MAVEAQGTNTIPSGYEHVQDNSGGYGSGPGLISLRDELEVICGPLLNYRRMSDANSNAPRWHGSVLLVTKPGQHQPELHLKKDIRGVDLRNEVHANTNGTTSGDQGSNHGRSFQGTKLYADPNKAFWRFELDLELGAQETRWEYTIHKARFVTNESPKGDAVQSFVVPAANQSMRIMFHSCNGFSVGTDVDDFSGPALWNDVLRMHKQKPFHVMLGGGDQIYNDGVRVDGPLKPWTAIGNPHKRREFPFPEKMRADCDEYYYNNYVRWYGQEPFKTANGQIAQVNIWDDHDIIDGFGSYTHHFMMCPVFRGIGGVAFKYYCLFQHHIPPPKSTFTTDAPQTTHGEGLSGPGADPAQLDDTFVLSGETPDERFIIGNKPGPYVEERSRSIYARLGANIAFCGIDARTERTRHQVNYPETYDLIFERLKQELSASEGKIKHLILLLGVPIAYPRLAWLENLFSSPLIAPIRLLNKRFGIAGGLFNKFDGQVDLLDDLDDHYTARNHKKERKMLIHQLQHLSQRYNVRITILGGDVHLAAMGRFYSNPKLNIAPEKDHRYMANIISSAITNKPPPKAVANLLARRNKIHHLDHDTDETLMALFDKDPGSAIITSNSNSVTMPSRNYAIISECIVEGNGSLTNGIADVATSNGNGTVESVAPKSKPKNGHKPLHAGEEGAGTKHNVADIMQEGFLAGGLDVCYRVEIDQHDRDGKTEGYGFSIPPLALEDTEKTHPAPSRDAHGH